MERIEHYMSKMGLEKYYKIPLIQKASKLTNQKPSLIVFALLCFVIFLCLTPIGGFLTTLLAFTIPAFKTFKALESEEKEDDKRLLTFWVTFGFFYFFDQMLSWFLSFIPLYYIFRTAMVFYLFHPETGGSEKLYNNLI